MPVGQTIGFCRLSFHLFEHDRPQKAMVCPTASSYPALQLRHSWNPVPGDSSALPIITQMQLAPHILWIGTETTLTPLDWQVEKIPSGAEEL
jgi:hypothetical protein